jgi:HAD superfamily hydrolase (TIGR01549 family)
VERLVAGWGIAPDVPVLELQARLREERAAAERAADANGGAGPDYRAVTGRVLAEAGLRLDEWQVHEIWEAQNVGGHFMGRQVFEDAVETLQWLRARGVRIAALTNRSHGGAAFLEELRQEGLLEHFEVVVSSDQVGYRKPHLAIFARALEALGLRGEECAHVGDRLVADVEGARRAGMTAVWMRALAPADAAPERPEQQPDHTIGEIGALRHLGLF